MNWIFFKYFFSYILKARTRQKLIFLTIIGLLISAFSLTVLQGIMGGLQNGLVKRSKDVLGLGYVSLKNVEVRDKPYQELVAELRREKILFVPELELELMIQNENYISPVILHGLDYNFFVPEFLRDRDQRGVIMGTELSQSLNAFYESKLKITSPAHTDFVFGDIPRQKVGSISDFYSSQLSEIDSVHSWVRLSFVQDLIRSFEVNKLRIFKGDLKSIKAILLKHKEVSASVVSWEKENSTLVWALNLETRVMLFLFVAMSVLIGICITSGFLIFYNKIKTDLSSFWILGLSKDRLMLQVYLLGQGISILFCFLGVVMGLIFLWLLDSGNFVVMPEQFVERNIPVIFSLKSTIVSFLVPYIVASIFTHITFKVFKKENVSFLSFVRKVG